MDELIEIFETIDTNRNGYIEHADLIKLTEEAGVLSTFHGAVDDTLEILLKHEDQIDANCHIYDGDSAQLKSKH